MSEFYFGTGSGRITRKECRRREQIARKHDSEFICVTGNSGHCTCGHGCQLGSCPNKRWWFATRNYGEPFNSQTAKTVMEEVGQ